MNTENIFQAYYQFISTFIEINEDEAFATFHFYTHIQVEKGTILEQPGKVPKLHFLV